jgi:hypothetical protein
MVTPSRVCANLPSTEQTLTKVARLDGSLIKPLCTWLAQTLVSLHQTLRNTKDDRRSEDAQNILEDIGGDDKSPQ